MAYNSKTQRDEKMMCLEKHKEVSFSFSFTFLDVGVNRCVLRKQRHTLLQRGGQRGQQAQHVRTCVICLRETSSLCTSVTI